MTQPVIKNISITSPDGNVEMIAAEQVNDNTYMFLENPLFSCRINFGSFVEVRPNEKGELSFVRLVKASKYKTRQFLLNAQAKDIDFSRKIGDPIIAAGGTWEVANGGTVFIHIPKESRFDLDLFFRENDFHPAEIFE
jgi:hypothetical protein